MSADAPRQTPPVDRLPKAIGPYAIRERIGRGAMGVVYRAVHEAARAVVALKVMVSDLDGDPETRERFFREAHVAGKLRHRNIVTVVDSGEDAGRLYIAMELLTGGTLTDLLKDSSALDLEDRVDIMLQVCQGLSIAHGAGVYHRDLKPANLFICDDRRVKILDFGVARLVGSNMTVTGNIIGTPDFMSPEQVRGRDIDGRSDIFSLGSVFYLLLTGRKPFAANDLPAVLNKVVRSQTLPIREDEAPEEIAAVIRKMMAKDPAARQQDINELACDLMSAASAIASRARQTALHARGTAEQIARLVERRVELSTILGLPDPGHDPWLALTERYPVLHPGPAVLGTFPLRSAAIMDIDAVLQAELGTLRPAVDALEEGHAKLAAGRALQQTGALDQAAEQYAAARRAVPASPTIERAIEACYRAIEDRREQEARLQARITLANDAVQRADWPGVLAVVKDIEEIDAGNAVAESLRAQATRNLEAERAKQARERAERERADRDRAEREAAASTPSARAAIEAGERSSGTSGTRRHVAGAVSSVSVGNQTADRGERIARAARLNDEANRYVEAGDLIAAERLASQSVELNAEDKETRHLLERIRTAMTLRGQQDEKWKRVTDLLRRASTLADHKDFAKALAIVDEALLVDATNVNAVTLRARIAGDRVAHDAAKAAEAAREQRARAAAPMLRKAQRAFEAGDLETARWSAESALALAPESNDAMALLARITAAMPVPSPDDTVKFDDPQSDTAQIGPDRSSVLNRVVDIREQASGWLGKWRASKTGTKDR